MIHFFLHLKQSGLPVTIKELLDLLEALDNQLCQFSIDEFYFLARLVMIKDERYYDRFDVAFANFLNQTGAIEEIFTKDIPNEWLTKKIEKYLSEEEKAKIKSLGGFDELMKTFAERLKEQTSRHQGGNKWIGTGGTSPFGAYGYHPEGIRMGQSLSRHQRAVKVWHKREFQNLDEDSVVSKRNMAIALKRLKQKKNIGPNTQFDLETTIAQTAKNAGLLDLAFKLEKKQNFDVLMLFDVGGSMDFHIELTRSLFAAAKTSFKSLTYFYFHNCPYETVWRDNSRRQKSSLATNVFLKKFHANHKLIIVGDASMSPYELNYPGGSVEHMNQEPGQVWLKRILDNFESAIWLNPLEQKNWYAESLHMVQYLMDKRMFPLTAQGISKGMEALCQ